MSINWQPADNPPPRLVVLPPGAASLDEAQAAVELWEFYKRRELDPSQRLDVEVMLAVRPDGLWAAGVTGHEKPRQNGKGDSIECVELWGLTQRSERILHTIHDAVLLATETQSRMLSLLEGHPDLRRLKLRAWQGTGQQMIELRNGGIIWYRTRTGGGARGIDEVDRVVVDEAQHAELEHLSAITPTQAVSANPQLNALGTGGLEGKSGWWWSLRKQTKWNTPDGFGYVGFSAQPWEVDESGSVTLGEVDPFDRKCWWDTNAALHAGRITEEYLDRQLRILGADAFAQEHLCVWAPPPPDGNAEGPIAAHLWAAALAPDSVIESNLMWALAVSPDRKWAAVGKAGRSAAGQLHVETVAHERNDQNAVVARVLGLWAQKPIPIRILRTGAAKAYIAVLREKRVEVAEVSAEEYAQASGQIIDAAMAGRLARLDQRSLSRSVTASELGPTGAFRPSGMLEISPLEAVTVAAGGVLELVAASGLVDPNEVHGPDMPWDDDWD